MPHIYHMLLCTFSTAKLILTIYAFATLNNTFNLAHETF